MEQRRVCVRGLIVKNGTIFAQKLKNADGSAKGFWCTPGGGIDPLESLHGALHREMVEETGIAPQVGRLVLVQQFKTNNDTSHGEAEQLEFFFEITNADDYQVVDLATTSHGDAEIAEYGFVDPRTEHLLPTILTTEELYTALNNPHAPVLFHYEL